jgi:hypothetical protein
MNLYKKKLEYFEVDFFFLRKLKIKGGKEKVVTKQS